MLRPTQGLSQQNPPPVVLAGRCGAVVWVGDCSVSQEWGSVSQSACVPTCASQCPPPSAISKQRLPFPCQRLRGVFSHLRPENVVGLLEKPTEVCRPQAGSPGISCTRLQPVPAPLVCIPGWPQHWSLPDERWARVCSHLCDGVCPVTSHCQRL